MWPGRTFHDFGPATDGSSNCAAKRTRKGWQRSLQFCASHARPIYGWLLQATYGQTGTVQDLQWMRFGASLLLGALALVSFRGLRALGWSFSTSLCFAVLLALIPSAQVIAGWAVGWPYAATALLAFGGFFTAEGALSVGMSAGPGRAVAQWMVALGLMVVGALIYQPSALFYVVPLAGALIVQRHRTPAQTIRWAGIHLGFVVSGRIGLWRDERPVRNGSVANQRSGRIAFEAYHWSKKMAGSSCGAYRAADTELISC